MPAKPKPKPKPNPSPGSKAASESTPKPSRPVVPPGYHFPTSPEGILDWTWARERLTNSQNYVIVTVRPDGRPHAMGMHGIWHDNAYYFGTDSASRKAKNLEQNPNCIVITEKLDEIVIVEGVATLVSFDELPEELSPASKTKYGWPMQPHRGGAIYRVKPRVVFAFPLAQIATAVTRWKF